MQPFSPEDLRHTRKIIMNEGRKEVKHLPPRHRRGISVSGNRVALGGELGVPSITA